MRILPIRTISGRIVLGFLLLLMTFSSVSAYSVYSMSKLGEELRFLRTAYLEVWYRVIELQTWQRGVVDELDEAPPPRRAFLDRLQAYRKKLLLAVNDKLGSMDDLSPSHRTATDRMQERIDFLLRTYDANVPLYQRAFAATGLPDDRKAALAEVKQSERALLKRTQAWLIELRRGVEAASAELERAEQQARLGVLVLGAIASFAGLLVTVWAVLTLRPLKRLRDGARRIAGGDYRQRVAVAGGTEVSDLAQEFNNMAGAIEEREQDLVRSERLAAVGKMAAVITHEIRNPLSSIGLNAELLEEELGRLPGASSEASGLCRAIGKEVDRLTGITEEYLRFARLPRPRLEPEQVNEIVSSLLSFQREELELMGVKVSSELEDGLPPVAADEAQLRQALLNLVRNAADAVAVSGGGGLSVSTTRGGDDSIEVSVADTGPGIPADVLPRIFEPFFSTKEKGTGLGLALAQQIVSEHGGRIDVESTVGVGTRFVVKLPAAGC